MIEALLNKPYWVIDFLPRQVPEGSAGQFFAVEQFYLQEPRQSALRRQFAEILLKLNCYFDLLICEPEEENWARNPAPDKLLSWLTQEKKDLCVLLPEENTLITVNRADLYMTVYGPSESLLKLLGQLAVSAGLFLWQPPRQSP